MTLTRSVSSKFMIEPLTGLEFRVFRSLAREYDRDTIEAIRVQLTQGQPASTEHVEDTLEELAKRALVEEYRPGNWRVTMQGHMNEKSLLGEHP
jgi:hypothetical protein